VPEETLDLYMSSGSRLPYEGGSILITSNRAL
jgi:hypothetical protein